MKEEHHRLKLWIAWERQRRSTVLSQEAGAELFQFDCGGVRVLRYLICGLKTLLLLCRKTPNILFVQNPSMALALLAVVYRRLDLSRVVVDFHTPTIELGGLRAIVFEFLVQYINRSVDLVIVSNEGMKAKVELHGGRGFVLPDKIPTFKKLQKRKLKGKYNILFVSSFAEDEPFQEVVEAARGLDDIYIYITGNPKRAPHNLVTNAPSNVSFTGYLPEEEYMEFLNSVDAVMDLTTRQDCLVCGAYEAVAVGKPLITSNTKALMRYFNSGTVYAGNTQEGIAKAIRTAIDNISMLENEIKRLGEMRSAEWKEQFNELMNLMK